MLMSHFFLFCLVSISPTFYEQLFDNFLWPKKLLKQTVSKEKLCKTLLHKSAAACKMFVIIDT